MVTYPSTHGVFEAGITRLCDIVHAHGGQVYVDGANLNALVGLAGPGAFGADVSHLNLHKTFCIPHGGGGPGVGPVACKAHLAPFLPGHRMMPAHAPAPACRAGDRRGRGRAVRLGVDPADLVDVRDDDGRRAGSRRATESAILAANYIARRLAPHYPVLFSGPGGLCRARMHPRPAAAQGDVGRRGRGRRQAPDRLRLPRADDELPGARAR